MENKKVAVKLIKQFKAEVELYHKHQSKYIRRRFSTKDITVAFPLWVGCWELHFRGKTNEINAFPVERRERRVPQIYKPSAKWMQMCLQPSFFEATILWNAYRVRPIIKIHSFEEEEN